MSWIRKLFGLPPKKKNPFTKKTLQELFADLEKDREASIAESQMRVDYLRSLDSTTPAPAQRTQNP